MSTQRTLLYGTRGSDVRELQMLLNRLIDPRPDITVDGQFGNGTKSMVVRLQKQFNAYPSMSRKVIGGMLETDGIVGPNTWKVIAEAKKWDDYRIPAGHATLIRHQGRVVPHFCQADPRWGSILLGSKSIASKGCAMCSVAMCLAYYGRDVTPATLDAYLDENNGYVGNNIVWQTGLNHGQKAGSPRLRLTLPNYRDREDFYQTIVERIWYNKPTLIGIDYGTSGDGNEDHWVVAVGHNERDIIINDPALSAGNGAQRPSQEITNLYNSRRRGGLTPVRLCLFDV